LHAAGRARRRRISHDQFHVERHARPQRAQIAARPTRHERRLDRQDQIVGNGTGDEMPFQRRLANSSATSAAPSVSTASHGVPPTQQRQSERRRRGFQAEAADAQLLRERLPEDVGQYIANPARLRARKNIRASAASANKAPPIMSAGRFMKTDPTAPGARPRRARWLRWRRRSGPARRLPQVRRKEPLAGRAHFPGALGMVRHLEQGLRQRLGIEGRHDHARTDAPKQIRLHAFQGRHHRLARTEIVDELVFEIDVDQRAAEQRHQRRIRARQDRGPCDRGTGSWKWTLSSPSSPRQRLRLGQLWP
jgi:hypothetical protein